MLHFFKLNKLLLFSFVIFFFSILTVSYLYQSELRRPIEKTIEVFININALNVAMFFTLRLIFIKTNISNKFFFSISLILGSLTFLIADIGTINYNFNSVISTLVPLKLVLAVLDDRSFIFWTLPYIFILSLICFYINIKSNHKKSFVEKTNNSLLSYSLLIYSILNITVWLFTHFSFISAHSLYMSNKLLIINEIFDDYEKNGNKNLLNKKGFYIVDNNNLMKSKGEIFLKENILEGNLIHVKFTEWFYTYQNNSCVESLSIDDINDFITWLSFSMNTAMSKKVDKSCYFSTIIPNNDQIKIITHIFLAIKPIEDNKSLLYINTSSLLKQTSSVQVFNNFYASFHIIYWIAFIILFTYHQKTMLKYSEKRIKNGNI